MNKVMTPFGMMENHSTAPNAMGNPNAEVDQQDSVSRMAFIDPRETMPFDVSDAEVNANYLEALEVLVMEEPSVGAYYRTESIDEMVF